MNKEILNKLIKIAEEQNIKVDLSKASPEKTLKDLGLDSLGTIGIIVGVENELNIRISDENLGKIKTLGELISAFENSLQNK